MVLISNHQLSTPWECHCYGLTLRSSRVPACRSRIGKLDNWIKSSRTPSWNSDFPGFNGPSSRYGRIGDRSRMVGLHKVIHTLVLGVLGATYPNRSVAPNMRSVDHPHRQFALDRGAALTKSKTSGAYYTDLRFLKFAFMTAHTGPRKVPSGGLLTIKPISSFTMRPRAERPAWISWTNLPTASVN